MKRIIAFLLISILAVSCGENKALLPNVSGKAGEVVVVIEKADWEGALGNGVREVIATDCPWLPVREPLYSLVNVPAGSFADLFKVHRNIVYFNIDPQCAAEKVDFRKDVWADTQCIVQVSAFNAENALKLFDDNSSKITAFIEQAERERVIRNSIQFEVKEIAPQVEAIFGGSPHFPTGFRLMKKTADFAWVQYEKQFSTQGILIYRYPATRAEDELSLGNIVARRNEFLKNNVPGMFENTYMTTGNIPEPTVEYLKFQGRDFAQVRGWWEVENDYMGGPFVSHSFYSQDGQYVIVEEAFVYAPKYDKRQFLRQTESIIYSWEWAK